MKTIFLFGCILFSANLWGQQLTYVTDEHFEQELIDMGYDDVLDGYVLTSNVDTIEILNLAFRGISDLTGIEDFVELTFLDCQSNYLTEIDLSQNTNLIKFQCFGNQLIELDISHNTNLSELYCSSNQLTSLDVSQNPDLFILHCAYNAIENINVSQNPDLVVLYAPGNVLNSLYTNGAVSLNHLDCSFCSLTRLDVSSNVNLTELDCQFNQLTCLNVANGNNDNFNYLWPGSNPNLTCIEVDDVDWCIANWNNFDPQYSFSDYCNNGCSSSITGLNDYTGTPKTLIKILDLMGRETTFKPNKPLIYVYDDGSIEKVFTIE